MIKPLTNHGNKNIYPDNSTLIVILGPTAVGKTSLSLQLARDINGEIISADSMQIYKDMDIGTAKASQKERNIIPHYMIDIIKPDQEFSVAEYQAMVDNLIPGIVYRNKVPILVGGTGLYIRAVIEGFLFPEMDKNIELRQKLQKEAQQYGNKYVYNKLKKIDPELAKKLHPNDLRRVIRGIEVYHQTGKTMTYFKKEKQKKGDRYRNLKIGLYREREELYKRINKRVDIMIEQGLIDEVKYLLTKYPDLSKTARQGLGYKEIIGYLKREYDREEAIRLLKRNTRRYAKRQLTWFRRDQDINWFNLSTGDYKKIYSEIKKLSRDFLLDF
ncbi:tRNA (adenosine(37)-N6)-dimethylallyltransferase MiaA [Halothermothrix orenii]|uniref:tRNA dimethylallyltransferase n=1 Tax=Halothermothrix orenii (strain H 168 / OCM 544 / DSM 9562) TaxID=373903 RepID=MIAA_HALOH|nr:tRNA (adenosine(37)-N6)-dimethylallyltransferase MiaA [Halothermothrix orenii]B8CX96.1 RecName: Full=tRNA dimethylallyltransferase; AltName: Full=Dimethylallyl diphosphate:tRNA dimethylallyltransferase; Short=DMAPP:tRNA dimethylallyltransferase; Short=DMATase; AltName: Full=Isopentenyl-diphosphate:tRNA isopentenyltransferase; Short=IPP transferase; Short=IPPT; Short=IPTase [Halothermothrix orenii H 168]ACL69915.1 tRNA delta(2)-isopentenylpyrophosphate transferase [Halothermothrix orenii H 168]